MDLQLKDKVVVITGGASGIGAAIVKGAAREGATPLYLASLRAMKMRYAGSRRMADLMPLPRTGRLATSL